MSYYRRRRRRKARISPTTHDLRKVTIELPARKSLIKKVNNRVLVAPKPRPVQHRSRGIKYGLKRPKKTVRVRTTIAIPKKYRTRSVKVSVKGGRYFKIHSAKNTQKTLATENNRRRFDYKPGRRRRSGVEYVSQSRSQT